MDKASSITTDELVAQVILRATGEPSKAVFGDKDYTKVQNLANAKIDAWAKEAEWASLYSLISIGYIGTTDTYDLDSDIRVISQTPGDYVQVTKNGQTYNFTTVKSSALKRYPSGNYCARVGQSLKFNRVFKSSDPEFGGSITVPCYIYPDKLTKARSEVPVDDPNWLVAATAADYVQTSYTMQQNRPAFLSEAADLMQGMLDNNTPQQVQVPRHSIMPGLRSW